MKFIRDLIDQKSQELEAARPIDDANALTQNSAELMEPDLHEQSEAASQEPTDDAPFEADDTYRVLEPSMDESPMESFEEQDRDIHTAAAETIWDEVDGDEETENLFESDSELVEPFEDGQESAGDILSEFVDDVQTVEEVALDLSSVEPPNQEAFKPEGDHEPDDMPSFEAEAWENDVDDVETASETPSLSVVDAVREAHPELQKVLQPQMDAVTEPPELAAEAAPEVEQATSPVEVPLPAGGRGKGRAGRAKTRLLGFNAAMGSDTDPFSKAAKAEGEDGYTKFPVGWLVVTDGPGRGAAFTLFNGVAQIGRGEGQTIRLDFGDNSIFTRAPRRDCL